MVVYPENPRYFRRAGAASYLTDTYGFPCSRAWLAKLASTGGGPVYRKAGRVPIYAGSDLDRWAQARFTGPFRASGVTAPNPACNDPTGASDG